jgi:hypothetical protein
MSLVTRGLGPFQSLATVGLGVATLVVIPPVVPAGPEVRPPIRTRVRITNTYTVYDGLTGTLTQPVGPLNSFEIELDEPLVILDRGRESPRFVRIVTVSRGKIVYLES